MRPTVYRSWIQGAILIVCFGTVLLVAIATVTTEDVARHDYGTLAMYSVIGAFGAYGVWRSNRLGVRVGPDGLQIRSIGRDKLVPWSAITDVAPNRATAGSA